MRTLGQVWPALLAPNHDPNQTMHSIDLSPNIGLTVRSTNVDISGTHLQGYAEATLSQLVALIGWPETGVDNHLPVDLGPVQRPTRHRLRLETCNRTRPV